MFRQKINSFGATEGIDFCLYHFAFKAYNSFVFEAARLSCKHYILTEPLL